MDTKKMSVWKIVLIIVLIIVAIIAVGVFCLSRMPVVSEDYTSSVKTGGDIEAKYLQSGVYEVAYKEISVMESFEKYEIWYPSDIENSENTFPAVVFCNGTGVKASKYAAVLEHLASWGFIVFATEEEYSWNGFSAEMCLRLAIKLNEQEQFGNWEINPFIGKIDLEHIGVSGHSQGGVGVISAATEIKHASMIKAVYAASPTSPDLATALEWDYDATKITVPTLLVAGTGDVDSNTICPLTGLQQIYSDIPDSVTKVMCRRNDGDHGDMLTFNDGYMTAFFMWQLQGDKDAGKAFVGEGAEILTNGFYQDIAKNK